MKVNPIVLTKYELNKQQIECITKSFDTYQHFFIVYGCPGSGKTFLINPIISNQFITKKNSKILILTNSIDSNLPILHQLFKNDLWLNENEKLIPLIYRMHTKSQNNPNE